MLASASAKDVIEWRVHFAEVFGKTAGFDIVLANPPYVRQELIREIKPRLKTTYADLYCGTADLYYYFYIRSLQILRPSGMLVFISSNKWFRANYGAGLRRHVAKTCRVLSITDFGGLPVFESATAYPMIFVAQRISSSETSNESEDRCTGETLFTEVATLDPPYPDVRALVDKHGVRLPSNAIDGAQWTLAGSHVAGILQKMKNAGVPLGEYVSGRIYRGVLTGLNEAFVIDAATRDRLIGQDPRSAELTKPFLLGRDIKRYAPPKAERFLVLIPRGWTTLRYAAARDPWKAFQAEYRAIAEHLRPFADAAQKRYDKGEYWWELRACDYYGEFEKPKILFPDIANEPQFTLARDPMYAGNTAYIIPRDDLFLLAVLNSTSVEVFYSELSSQVRGGYLRFIRQYVEQIPIPSTENLNRTGKRRHDKLVTLVERMLELQEVLVRLQTGPTIAARRSGLQPDPLRPELGVVERQIAATDDEIDHIVYELYGLTDEEIALVGNSVKK